MHDKLTFFFSYYSFSSLNTIIASTLLSMVRSIDRVRHDSCKPVVYSTQQIFSLPKCTGFFCVQIQYRHFHCKFVPNAKEVKSFNFNQPTQLSRPVLYYDGLMKSQKEAPRNYSWVLFECFLL